MGIEDLLGRTFPNNPANRLSELLCRRPILEPDDRVPLRRIWGILLPLRTNRRVKHLLPLINNVICYRQIPEQLVGRPVL